MRLHFLLVLCSICLAGCGIKTLQYYDGPPLPEGEAAVYLPFNATGYWASINVYSLHIDSRPIQHGIPGVGNPLAVQPGQHSVRVTFIDRDNVWLPTFMKENVFQGWYDLTFEAKPNMFYAPIFDLSLPKKDQVTRVCIAEVPNTKSFDDNMDATREKGATYVACAGPNIPPTEENIKLCKSWHGAMHEPPTVYAEFCHQTTAKP